MHSHWGTRNGYVLRTEAELAQQRRTWNSDPTYATEQEMADYLRSQSLRAILDLGFTKTMSVEEAQPHHNYALGAQRDYPDAIFGLWLQIDPRTGTEGAAEWRAGMHIQEDAVILEIADPGTKVVLPEGEKGSVFITTCIAGVRRSSASTSTISRESLPSPARVAARSRGSIAYSGAATV